MTIPYPDDERRYICFAGIFAIARSVIATIVNDGFTPGFAGMAEPSQTRRFS